MPRTHYPCSRDRSSAIAALAKSYAATGVFTHASEGASWSRLATLRKRGQIPTDGVWIFENQRQLRSMESSGFFSLNFPRPEDVRYLAGLDVVMVATRSKSTMEVAQQIAVGSPRFFAVYWQGVDRDVARQVVIDER